VSFDVSLPALAQNKTLADRPQKTMLFAAGLLSEWNHAGFHAKAQA
jgi:hypothetical protein